MPAISSVASYAHSHFLLCFFVFLLQAGTFHLLCTWTEPINGLFTLAGVALVA